MGFWGGFEKQAISRSLRFGARISRFLKPKGFKALPKDVERGFRRQALEETSSPGSMVLWLPRLGVEKGLSALSSRRQIRKLLEKAPKSMSAEQKKKFIEESMKTISPMGRASAARKIRGKVWKNLERPMHDLNIRAGQSMGMIPGLKSLFTETHKVPIKIKGQTYYKEVKAPSLTAPATKALDLATPIIVGVSLEKAVKKLRGRKDTHE